MNDPLILVVPREAVEHRVRKSKVTLTERSRADDELHHAIRTALTRDREALIQQIAEIKATEPGGVTLEPLGRAVAGEVLTVIEGGDR